ncbi:hypothetical protein TNCT_42211 [Trichonephila clavata]|uniref:Uncharacterized protein n=1 Tax=Trichonephila clavata TaxID=2740835 RepID=A0A8X6H6R6_TRICU|nr:hypothetical protein TNCT_42211 [Trichonephila clavata]
MCVVAQVPHRRRMDWRTLSKIPASNLVKTCSSLFDVRAFHKRPALRFEMANELVSRSHQSTLEKVKYDALETAVRTTLDLRVHSFCFTAYERHICQFFHHSIQVKF